MVDLEEPSPWDLTCIPPLTPNSLSIDDEGRDGIQGQAFRRGRRTAAAIEASRARTRHQTESRAIPLIFQTHRGWGATHREQRPSSQDLSKEHAETLGSLRGTVRGQRPDRRKPTLRCLESILPCPSKLGRQTLFRVN